MRRASASLPPPPRCTRAVFLARVRERKQRLLGVLGFAGAWSHTGLAGEALEAHVARARAALEQELLAAKKAYGESLLVVSGATRAGVLALTYELCAQHGLAAIGLAPRQVLRHEVARLDYLVLEGERFGDESPLFLLACDEFLLLGGGAQSRAEVLAATERRKPVTVVQGFGGVADAFTPETLPSARFVLAAEPAPQPVAARRRERILPGIDRDPSLVRLPGVRDPRASPMAALRQLQCPSCNTSLATLESAELRRHQVLCRCSRRESVVLCSFACPRCAKALVVALTKHGVRFDARGYAEEERRAARADLEREAQRRYGRD